MKYNKEAFMKCDKDVFMEYEEDLRQHISYNS